MTRKLRLKYIIPYLDYGIAVLRRRIGKRKIYDRLARQREKFYLPFQKYQ